MFRLEGSIYVEPGFVQELWGGGCSGSAEWTPPATASAQAASTAARPSLSTADSTLTIWRSPSSEPFSLRRTSARLAGNGQSLNGAPFLSAPGFLASTGT